MFFSAEIIKIYQNLHYFTVDNTQGKFQHTTRARGDPFWGYNDRSIYAIKSIPHVAFARGDLFAKATTRISRSKGRFWTVSHKVLNRIIDR